MGMSLETLYETFEVFIQAEMVGVFWTGVIYTFEDRPFNENIEPTEQESWIKFAIHPGVTRRSEIRRGGLGIRYGTIIVDVNVPRPPFSDKRQGAIYADQLAGVLKNSEMTGIAVEEPETRYRQPRDYDWLKHVVTVPFWTTT